MQNTPPAAINWRPPASLTASALVFDALFAMSLEELLRSLTGIRLVDLQIPSSSSICGPAWATVVAIGRVIWAIAGWAWYQLDLPL